MADRKEEFGTVSQAITITLASLAGNSTTAGRESTAIDNSTNKFLDAALYFKFKLTTGGTLGGDKAFYIYVYGSEDGTNYTDNATGTDAALTFRIPTNLRLLETLAVPDYTSASVDTFKYFIPSVASAFRGILPRKWGVVVRNRTNIALTSSESDHVKEYQGFYETTV